MKERYYPMAKKYDYKKLTFEEMKEYIETNAAADKEWFKSVAIILANW